MLDKKQKEICINLVTLLVLCTLVSFSAMLGGCADSSITNRYHLDQEAGDCSGSDSSEIPLPGGSVLSVPCGSNVVILEVQGVTTDKTTRADQTTSPESSIPIAYNLSTEKAKQQAGTQAGTSNTSGSTEVTQEPEPIKPEKPEEEEEKPGDTAEEEIGSTVENAMYRGLTNGDRPTWYFSKTMASYPKVFKVVAEGCTSEVVTNNGTRYEGDNGLIVKQSDVAGRGMAMLVKKGCGNGKAYVVY